MKAKKIVGTVLAAAAVAAAVAIDCTCAYFSDIINLHFRESVNTSFDMTADEALKEAQDFTKKEAEEGFILLKNDSKTLPLKDTKKINVFGNGSYQTLYQGSGSASSWFKQDLNTTVKAGLEEAGFEVNPGLWQFYQDHYQERKDQEGGKADMTGADASILEPALSEYDKYTYDGQNIKTYSESYSKTALFVVSRAGGEGSDAKLDMSGITGGDAGKHYLELQDVEIELLNYIKANYEKVIIVVNSATPMELGFIDDPKISACLWIGMPGSRGNLALGEILKGTINPSGHTPDTYAYAVESNPTYYNFGDYTYSNYDYTMNKYVYYQEGIYVGYRYYETAAADGYINYDDVVQFPFGYGLSYTTFEWSNASWNIGGKGKKIEVSVDVKNTGDVAGKDVVQLYYHAPYNKDEGIEKSEVVLGGFAKTSLLEPGKSERLTITMDYDDLSSYDYKTEKAYISSAGKYTLSLRSDSHTVKNELTHDFNIENKIVYNETNGKRSSDKKAATNLFDDVTEGDGTFNTDKCKLITRSDWAGTFPKSREQNANVAASEKIIALATNGRSGSSIDVDNLDKDHPDAKMPTMGAKNGFVISDMTGLDYDDPLWEKLLDQLTLDEMTNLFGKCGWHNPAVVSIEKAMAVDMDGAEGLHDLTTDKTSNQYATTCVLAASFNAELAKEFGEVYGNECLANGVSALYAPSMNIHRSPFGGRNFEYYSEDGVLSGKMAAAQIDALWGKGISVYIKHYMLNDQETNRQKTVKTWASEQAIREIYGRPFEISVKEGHATGFMAGYNAVGVCWTGASKALMTDLPRGEWGFNGRIITDACDDYVTYNSDAAVVAGVDMWLTAFKATLSEKITKSNYGMQCVRRAAHDQLYVFANSAAVGMTIKWNKAWIAIPVAANVILAGGAVCSILFLVLDIKKKKKGN